MASPHSDNLDALIEQALREPEAPGPGAVVAPLGNALRVLGHVRARRRALRRRLGVCAALAASTLALIVAIAAGVRNALVIPVGGWDALEPLAALGGPWSAGTLAAVAAGLSVVAAGGGLLVAAVRRGPARRV
jgi:hypothetical protein